MAKKKIPPIHPGVILQEEFLIPYEITNYRLSKAIHIPAQRIGDIVNGKRAITVDTAMRLARYFQTSTAFWLELQMHYDLDLAEDRIAKKINQEIIPFNSAA